MQLLFVCLLLWAELKNSESVKLLVAVCLLTHFPQRSFQLLRASLVRTAAVRHVVFIRRSLTLWRRNYFFFLILAHPVYKM